MQAEAQEWPETFFEPCACRRRRPQPDPVEVEAVAAMIRGADAPAIVVGGGVHHGNATRALRRFAEATGTPVVEGQAGKSSLPWDHPLDLGPVGVTRSSSANAACARADLVLGMRTRFADRITGSWALSSRPGRRLASLNVLAHDAQKHGAEPLCCDAEAGLDALPAALGGPEVKAVDAGLKEGWFASVDPLTAASTTGNVLPTADHVIGAVQRVSGPGTVVMSAVGTRPGELHEPWKATALASCHLGCGFSWVGCEVAGAVGLKMAEPERDVACFVGDGSHTMGNGEMATAAMLGVPSTAVADDRDYGRIDRLQVSVGGAKFNNLPNDARGGENSRIDVPAHAAAMGATAVAAGSMAEPEAALARRHEANDLCPFTPHGGHWWDMAVPEASERKEVRQKRADYRAMAGERG